MSEEKIREIFAKNLNRYLEANGKQPADIVRDLGVPFSTVSNWINGLKLPRMGKVEMLANYFGIEKSDLLEEKRNESSIYYLNPETAALALQMFEDSDMRSLFSMKRNMDPVEFKNYMDFMKAQYRREHPEEDDDFGC